MEGRVSRVDLSGDTRSSTRGSYAGETQETPRSSHTARYGGSQRSYASRSPRRNTYRSYSRRKAQPPGIIPEGRDLLIVQIFASGVLLLFVMFVSIVDSSGTQAVRGKLTEAFSNSVTYAEVTEGAASVKERILGGKGSVLELFGGEPESGEVNTEELMELADFPAPEPIPEEESGVVIDAETLKEINKYLDEEPKNQ